MSKSKKAHGSSERITDDSEKIDGNFSKPDWVPENPENPEAFTVSIVSGVERMHDGLPKKSSADPNDSEIIRESPAVLPSQKPAAQKNFKKHALRVEDYVQGVLANDRSVLAKTITLIESNSRAHQETARAVLNMLLPHSGRSVRIGISGVPGAGKSTLIEALGTSLIAAGKSVAVLTVDPSSSLTKGSILGDKTRMSELAKMPACFIRPSPSGGTLGGVTRKSRETILACEAAGYSVILIETVGVGQSEITVRSMVDFFLLVLIAGGGDELQGIKKGIMEIADAVVINKADGGNEQRAEAAKSEYEIALHYSPPYTIGWKPPVSTVSAITKKGIPEIWECIESFTALTKEKGIFDERRRLQSLEWVFALVEDELKNAFYNNPSVAAILPSIKERVLNGTLLPTEAALQLAMSNE